MTLYRVHFVPIEGDSETVEVDAENCDGAVRAAIEKAKSPENNHDPENCTRIDVSSIWADRGDKWIKYGWLDGHWAAYEKIPKAPKPIDIQHPDQE